MARIYLPPDANTLLWVINHCLRSWDRINVIVAGKQPELQWLNMDAAIKHCEQGIGIWDWASNDRGAAPDVVMACAGDVPTLEALAATDLLRRQCPDLRIRSINVVDLMTLQPRARHPHGLTDAAFDALFPPGVDRIGRLAPDAGYLQQGIRDKLIEHERFVRAHGRDMPEIETRRWPSAAA